MISIINSVSLYMSQYYDDEEIEVSKIQIIHDAISDNDKDNDENIDKIIHPNGYLKIIAGCMFSGKTTYIIGETKKWLSIGKKVLTINYHLDKRYSDNKIVSHDNYGIDCMMLDELESLQDNIKLYDVIIVNEAQFFSDLKKNVSKWVDIYKKIVVLSGLDGDFKRNKFGELLDLIPHCDEYHKIKAYCSICKNGTPALFSLKLTDSEKLIEIGTEQYMPVCRKHYVEYTKNKIISTGKIQNVITK